ncbi:alpha/beta hydrolase [Jongsikchunia kroppenstedtii]|uniref:alpha/beta hydrolase n=1 Tax=Jongsikchunia kroppenstedtii TaxID=1121721 RepID=UPI00035CAD8D|nr:alpha/beta fold hydrolase [Jongsikchunia kroppenstedtii]
MTVGSQIVFIQGGGAGTHDEWDNKLVDSLRSRLGGVEIYYPRMPDEGDPSYAAWNPAIRRELTGLDDRAIAIGHSIGGPLLIQTLSEQPEPTPLAAIVLISAPFIGPGGWAGDEFELPNDLGTRLPPSAAVHLFHGLEDDIVPAAHAERYADVTPQATVHRLPGRDHQLNNDLREVASVLTTL